MERTTEGVGRGTDGMQRMWRSHSKQVQKGVQDVEKGVINPLYFCLNFKGNEDL